MRCRSTAGKRWSVWLDGHDVPVIERGEYAEGKIVPFHDPEGEQLALVDDSGTSGGQPWEHSPASPRYQIEENCGVIIVVRILELAVRMLSEIPGFQQREEHCAGVRQTIYEIGPGESGALDWRRAGRSAAGAAWGRRRPSRGVSHAGRCDATHLARADRADW